MRITVLSVPSTEIEAAADRLWTAGARAVEETAVADAVELRTVLSTDDAISLARLGELPAEWTVTFIDVDDLPAESWRDHVGPVEINDELTLRPAWLPQSSDPPGAVVVEIEPAGSFGLGDHPTTRLSADAVWRLVRPGDRVLDAGCGSGVLSIIAALRGARQVVAVDVAEAAYEATCANAARNGVDDVIDVATTPVGDLDGVFDLVVANILAPTLIALADDLRRLTELGGRLVISGVLAESHDHVIEALAPMQVTCTDVHDGWAAVEFAHPQS